MKTLDPNAAKPGDKVIFNFPKNGYPHDQKQALQHLTLGKEYTIRYITVYDWSSVVSFEEVPNQVFNTVHFANSEQEDITDNPEGDDYSEYSIGDGEGGVISLEYASRAQMKAEIKRLIELTESVDASLTKVALAVSNWRNTK
jgi:hypothetical protein